MLLGESRSKSVAPGRRRATIWLRLRKRVQGRSEGKGEGKGEGNGHDPNQVLFRPGAVTMTRVRVALGVGAVILALRGVAPVATASTELWQVSGLILAQVAAFLPLWRVRLRIPRRGRPRGQRIETRRWHELLRTRIWRTSSVLLVGANLALFANRFSVWQGHPAAAATAGTIGLTALLLGVVPVVLEPIAWRFTPVRWRRTERIDRLMDELRRSFTPQTGFDPDRGASGRPSPTFDQPGGEPLPRPARAVLRKSDGAALEWTGDRLTLVDPRVFAGTFEVPLTGRPGDGQVRSRRRRWWAAELVWFVGQDRFQPKWDPRAQPVVNLLMIDERGRLLLQIAVERDDTAAMSSVAAVAKAAGLPFAAYSLSYTPEIGNRILRLLFPPVRPL